MATAPLRRLQQLRGTDAAMEDFWALKDVSFDVLPARSSASSAATAPAKARC